MTPLQIAALIWLTACIAGAFYWSRLHRRDREVESLNRDLGKAYEAQFNAKARGDTRDLGRAIEAARTARTELLRLEVGR